jgi:hypothetical protein
MNTHTLIIQGKRFFGPLFCLAAGYATFACLRFTVLLIVHWHWGVTTPPSVSYISGGLVVTVALASAWLCGTFVWVGSGFAHQSCADEHHAA